MYNPSSIPGPVKRHLIATTNARADFINKLAVSVREGANHDPSDRITTLSVPVMVLWAQEDAVVPFAVALDYADRILDVELVLLPGAGHSPQMEAPVRVADAIRTFLKDQ
nr:alpha/beta fold hydrolase [Epibacterium ulvae]